MGGGTSGGSSGGSSSGINAKQLGAAGSAISAGAKENQDQQDRLAQRLSQMAGPPQLPAQVQQNAIGSELIQQLMTPVQGAQMQQPVPIARPVGGALVGR